MAAEIATLERVRAVAGELRADGLNPTADRVIARIGGGSKTTVLQHLRVLRSDMPATDDLPGAVMELVRPVAAAIFKAGRNAEAEGTRTATERMSSVLGELEEQIGELADENGRLALNISDLEARLEEARARNSRLEEDVRRGDARIAELRAMLSRSTADGALMKTLSRVEGLLSRTGSTPPARKTITLPRERTGKG